MAKFEKVTCYICGGVQYDPWGTEKGYTMVKCRDCGLVYLNPRPALDQIDEAARTGLHKAGENVMVAIGQYSRARAKEYRTKLQSLFPEGELGKEPYRWLDIGAGYGELLQALGEICSDGSELLGIEPCEPKVRKAKNLGLPVELMSLSEVKGTYTHISLINVFSHLPDPVEFLKELRPLMAPNCQFLLVTGNGGDLTREEFPGSLYLPDHLSFAGEQNVRTVFEKAGFIVKAIDRYPAGLSIDHPVVGFCKNIARRAMGRALVPLSLPEDCRFRSLWFRAEPLAAASG